jgi:peptidylprolyl isomerase
MATSKRERQKAARREKLERQERYNRRRKNIRRGIIVAIIAVLVVGTGAILFSGGKKTTATTTTSTTASASGTTTTTSAGTTTTIPTSFPAVADPSPAGTFGKAPTVVVPPGKAPTTMELSNLITGTGPIAEIGETLEVEYVLATYSTHKVVQSSWTSQPFSFKLGGSPPAVIVGWEEGVPGMRVGGRRELIIPPSLGYGNESPGSGIAANDTLVFVIDLLKITPPA